MNLITPISAKEIADQLNSTGITVDEWNRAYGLDEAKRTWKNYEAPAEALQLLRFSQFVCSWLEGSTWSILLINQNSYFQYPDNIALEALTGSSVQDAGSKASNGYFISAALREKYLPIISELIFFLLLRRGHASIVSSQSTYLSLQDGFVYFNSDDDQLLRATKIMSAIASNKFEIPDWIRAKIKSDQDDTLVSDNPASV